MSLYKFKLLPNAYAVSASGTEMKESICHKKKGRGDEPDEQIEEPDREQNSEDQFLQSIKWHRFLYDCAVACGADVRRFYAHPVGEPGGRNRGLFGVLRLMLNVEPMFIYILIASALLATALVVGRQIREMRELQDREALSHRE